VALGERLDRGPLARRGPLRQAQRLLDRPVRGLLALGIRRAVVVRPLRDRDPPEAHRARRIEAYGLAERALGLEVVECVDQAQPLVEVRLTLGRDSRDRLVVTPQPVEEHRRRRHVRSRVIMGGRRR
jgi:hypothetical protein